MNKIHLFVVVLLLMTVGWVVFAYKAFVLHFPLRPHATSNVWNIEAGVSFEAQGKPTKVALFIPKSTSRLAVLDESFVSQGFGLTTTIEDGNRRAEWSIRKASGKQTLYYHAVLRLVEHRGALVTVKAPQVEEPDFEGANLAAAQAILSQVKAQSADLPSLVGALLQKLNSQPVDNNVAMLLGAVPKEKEMLETAVGILALEDIPARIVHGIRLEEAARDVPIVHWLEVHDGKSWQAFGVKSGEPVGEDDLLPWWRGNQPLGQIKGGTKLKIKLSVSRKEEAAIEGVRGGGDRLAQLFLKFSPFSLPLRTQAVYRVLLLIPLGALLITILRNIVGLETFGTFMPVLIALAFREMELLKGLFFFSLVVGLGLAVRFYFEKLQLLLIPRLAAVLTVVVLILLGLSLITYQLGIEHGLAVALFPMVILTMTIERMSIIWEESGPAVALKRGAGSLLAAALVTIVMEIEFVVHLIFVFPELLLVVLAMVLLLGRYTGYRLFELMRFKALAGPG